MKHFLCFSLLPCVAAAIYFNQHTIWGSWSPCSITCGTGGIRTRELLEIYDNEEPSVVDEERSECAFIPCPQDCVQAKSSVLMTCNKQCDTGEMVMVNQVISPALGFNSDIKVKPCKDVVLKMICSVEPCAYDCQPSSDWSAWTPCNQSTDGKQWRNRTVVSFSLGVPGENKTCPLTEESRECQGNSTAAAAAAVSHDIDEDCLYSNWDPWTRCAGPCYKQLRFRYRYVSKLPSPGGVDCKASLLEQSEVCPSTCFQEKLNVFCAQRGRIGQIYAISQCNSKYFICMPNEKAMLNECPPQWFFDPVTANCRPVHLIRGCSGQLQGYLFYHPNIHRAPLQQMQPFGQPVLYPIRFQQFI